MTEPLELRTIHPEAVENAIKKADHYRLLNDPDQAESICLDVLAVDPNNEQALIILILAISDQIAMAGSSGNVRRAREYVKQLDDEYHRLYYTGLIYEREGRSFLTRNLSLSFAYESFSEAMTYFEQADALSPTTNDEAILRWNSCLRTIQSRKLERRHDDGELPLE